MRLAMLLPSSYSFRPALKSKAKKFSPPVVVAGASAVVEGIPTEVDSGKRTFLRILGLLGLGVVASQVLPKKAEAYVMGSTPTSNVVGLKDASDTRINPSMVEGQEISKFSINLASSSNVRVPATGKSMRVYATRFSLTANATSISFKFVTGGGDVFHEVYVNPLAGGLYGANNHPNYIQGGVDQPLYCTVSGTTTVQIIIDYADV